MVTASISDIATELILQIFESLDSCATIVALNRTSSSFYSVWRLNSTSISNAVLSRSIECFEEAQELIRVQKEALGRSCVQGRAGYLHRQIVDRNRNILRNASDVTRIKTREWRMMYQGVLSSDSDILDPDRPALFQRSRSKVFTRLCYRLWTVAAKCDDPEGRLAYLYGLSDSELYGMCRLASWLAYKGYLCFGRKPATCADLRWIKHEIIKVWEQKTNDEWWG